MTDKDNSQGKLFVVSGPSGSGKSTLTKMLLEKNNDIVSSISATTRQPREGDVDGREYFFLTEEEFKEKIDKDHFVEWCLVYGNYYGTPYSFITENLEQGRDVLLEIDVQGAEKIKAKYPDSIHIFVKAPSVEKLKERLYSRGKDNIDVIEKRIAVAEEEMARMKNYNYCIVNDNLEAAFSELEGIIANERIKHNP